MKYHSKRPHSNRYYTMKRARSLGLTVNGAMTTEDIQRAIDQLRQHYGINETQAKGRRSKVRSQQGGGGVVSSHDPSGKRIRMQNSGPSQVQT
jgi:hypothetical protein